MPIKQETTKVAVSLIAIALLSPLNSGASAQNNSVWSGIAVGIIGGLINHSLAENARTEWASIPEMDRACINIAGRAEGITTDILIQNGILPSDTRLSEVKRRCEQITKKQLRVSVACSIKEKDKTYTSVCDEQFAIQNSTNSFSPLTIAEAITAIDAHKNVTTYLFERTDAQSRRIQMMKIDPNSYSVPSPTWNCDHARNRTEVAICSSYELTLMDNMYVGMFNRLMGFDKTGVERKRGVERYKNSIACNGNLDCIYKNRFQGIESVSDALRANGVSISTYDDIIRQRQNALAERQNLERQQAERHAQQELQQQEDRRKQELLRRDIELKKAETARLEAETARIRAETEHARALASSANSPGGGMQGLLDRILSADKDVITLSVGAGVILSLILGLFLPSRQRSWRNPLPIRTEPAVFKNDQVSLGESDELQLPAKLAPKSRGKIIPVAAVIILVSVCATSIWALFFFERLPSTNALSSGNSSKPITATNRSVQPEQKASANQQRGIGTSAAEWVIGTEYLNFETGACSSSANRICVSASEYKIICEQAAGISADAVKKLTVLADPITKSLLEGGTITKSGVFWSQNNNGCGAYVEATGLYNGTSAKKFVSGRASSFVFNANRKFFVTYIDTSP